MNLFESFVSAWGEWMTQMSLQLIFVVLFIGVLDRLLYRWVRPQLLYALWGLVFLKLVISPHWSSSFSVVQFFNLSKKPTDSGNAPIHEVVESSGIGAEFWLFSIWFGITLVLGVISITRYRRQKKWYLSTVKSSLPKEFQSLYQEVGKKLNFKILPKVMLSEKIQSPFTFGFLKAQILLPADLVRRGNEGQLEHVLTHELTHIKKWDPQQALVQHVLQLLYWFHPLVYFAGKRIRVLREVRCDYQSLEYLRQNGDQYKSTLLTLGFEATKPNYSGALHFGFSSSELISRLNWLERKQKTFGLKERLLTTLIVGGVLLCGLPLSQADSRVRAHSSSRNPSSSNSGVEVVEVPNKAPVQNSVIDLPPGDVEEAQSALEHAQGCFQRRYVIFQLLAKENQSSDKVAFKGE